MSDKNTPSTFNLHKDGAKAKKTMEAILANKDPNFHAMTNPNNIIKNPNAKNVLPKLDTKSAKKLVDDTNRYNRNINKLNPLYTKFIPLKGYILRMYVRESKLTKMGWFSGQSVAGFDYVEVSVRAGSGARYTQSVKLSPYRFLNKAVIVAVPPFEQDLKVGDTVSTALVKSHALKMGETEFIIYDNFFTHPDKEKILPEPNIDNEDYGYCLVSGDFINGLLKRKSDE